MKRLMTTCLVCVLLTAAVSQGITVAAPPQGMTISFDENGNGNVNDNGVITTLQFGTDTPPIGHATLYYILPFTQSMTQGDIVVLEPIATAKFTSDVLRFIPVQVLNETQCRVYVYSEMEESEPLPLDMADTGIPTELMSNLREINEVGPENGFNGVTYQPPTNDDPGWMPGGVTYNFTSDVPEPATIALLGLGGLLFSRNRKFDKKQK